MPLLQTQRVTLTLGQKTICRQLNLDIHAHERWGILGQNGSGKTTLLHTLAGLHTATEGDILLRGRSLSQLSQQSMAQLRAILFQDSQIIFPQTVWEYCASGRYPHLPYFKKESAKDRQIVLHALQTMELDSLRDRVITQLSGGEKRRLAIAALLAQTPMMYLLDEPTNHLDVRFQGHSLHYFQHLTETTATSVVMSLHDINLAQRFCTHALLLLADGRTRQGPIREILTIENLEAVYQCEMTVIRHNEAKYWMPK